MYISRAIICQFLLALYDKSCLGQLGRMVNLPHPPLCKKEREIYLFFQTISSDVFVLKFVLCHMSDNTEKEKKHQLDTWVMNMYEIKTYKVRRWEYGRYFTLWNPQFSIRITFFKMLLFCHTHQSDVCDDTELDLQLPLFAHSSFLVRRRRPHLKQNQLM